MAANFTTPVGRLIQGSVYTPNTTDQAGNPLTIKSGVNVGQPKVEYFFSVAIPKGQEQHWNQTPWGAVIFNEGRTAFPQAHVSRNFSWKIIDGDSQELNQAVPPRRWCDYEGFPGHWIVKFKSGFAPNIYNRDGTAVLVEPDAVYLGSYVQVNANVAGNNNQQKPGVYINHSMVALSAHGERISTGPDVSAAGFGAAPLPAGASATPVGAAFNPAPAPVAAPPAAIQPPPPPPNPAILQMPPVPAGPQMTSKANGATYEQMRAAGWDDATLRAHGMML